MKNKFLVILIIVIVLLVGGLGYYTYFIWNKDVVSKADLTDTEMSTIFNGFPYKLLIENKSIKVKDLTSEQVIYIGYDGLNENQIVIGDSGSCDTSNNENLIKCIAKSLKLTDEQINKMNIKLWGDLQGGSTKYEMVSPEIVSLIIKNKLGLTNQFTESFVKSSGFSFIPVGFIYDKEINMMFIHENGGLIQEVNYIFNINSGYKENDIYKINFAEGVFDPTNTDPITFDLYSRSNPTNILEKDISNNLSEAEMKALVKKYKTSLDNYEITFKKVDNNYQFVSLDYIK